MIGKNTRLRYYLNSTPSHAPEDIESTEIIADFSEENVQANITANAWTFYGEDAAIIRTWKDDGKIYDGLPFKIEAYNNLNNVVGFDGLLDLTDNYQDNWNDSRRVTVNMKKAEGLNIFFDQLGSLSFAYLESKGVFTLNDYQDCDYVVEKKINLIEEMMNGIILFLMLTELIDQIKEIAEEVENLIAHATGGATGSVAATLLGVAKIAIKTAYALSILVVILDLAKQLFETFSPPLRTHKTLNLRVAMTKVCDYLGYGFNSEIDELDTMYYLPSNPQLEQPDLQNFLTYEVGTQTGLPHTQDAQYQCSAFFELMKKMFNGKFAISGGVCQFHPKGHQYWVKTSTYTMPQVKPKTLTTNASDLSADKILTFNYDLTDEYTVDNYTGTTYEIRTSLITQQAAKNNLLKGFEEINFEVCLGSQKTELTTAEIKLQKTGKVIDKVVASFNGSSHYYNYVKNNKIGVLKQTANWHALPKILKLTGRKLAADYRNTFSAKTLYQNYFTFDSFVLSNFGGQKEVFNEVRIPFGMNDFIELVDNSYFQDSQNRTGKIMSIKWNIMSDTATVNYWVKQVYTTNLRETYIEP